MIKRNAFGPAFAGLAVAITATTASASFITFNTIESFLAEGPVMVNHDTSSLAIDNAPQMHSSLTMGAMTISTLGNGLSVWDYEVMGSQATVGDQYVHVASNAMTVKFEFSVPIFRFGLHISDWGDVSSGSLWYSDNLGNFKSIANAPLADGNLIFFGVESEVGITSLTLNRTSIGDGFAMDNFFYQPLSVPAPGAMALLGLAGLMGARRRRA